VDFWLGRDGLKGADVEDVFQDVFATVARGIADFRKDRPGDTFRDYGTSALGGRARPADAGRHHRKQAPPCPVPRCHRCVGPTRARELPEPVSVCRTDARKITSRIPLQSVAYTARDYDASANGLRQHGHSPSYPLRRAENAVGCGRAIIALKASGARWA
jgi:hypothetical protein